MKFFTFYVFLVLSTILLSCNGNGHAENEEDTIYLETNDTGIVYEDQNDEVIYFVSSPGEIVDVLNQSDLKFKSGIIHDQAKSKNYLLQSSQALNLGIYSADLAYCAYYEEMNQAANMFFSVQELCRKLEVSYLLDNIQLSRVKSNIQNPDSVKVLSKEYNKVIYNHFIENNKQNVLALISIGGFVEGLYLAFNNIGKFDPESGIAQAIAEQKYAFEVLRDFIDQQKNDPLLSTIQPDIKKLNEVFESIKPLKASKTTVTNAKDGKITIGGSNKLLIDKPQYENLKKIIIDLRNKYTTL